MLKHHHRYPSHGIRGKKEEKKNRGNKAKIQTKELANKITLPLPDFSRFLVEKPRL
jgi:hypothetical protein